MEMGKLTAKLRDAVPVCLLVDGKEIKRYKNIEIPDELKKLEYQDFKFDVQLNGEITFRIMFEPGVLPNEFPQVRERKTRRSMATPLATSHPDKVLNEELEKSAGGPTQGTTTALAIIQPDLPADIIETIQQKESIESEVPAAIEIAYHVTGEQRKALVKAVSSFIGMPAIYQNAPELHRR